MFKSFARAFHVFALLSLVTVGFAQDKVDHDAVASIREEGFQNSKIMPALTELADVYGPRLTASPNIRKAQNWTMDLMKSWGIENVALEEWGEFGNGWNINGYSVEMLSPTYDRINAVPLAWSPSTSGTISGDPMIVTINSPGDLDKYRGKLKGKIILRGGTRAHDRFSAPGKRYSAKELERAKKATAPYQPGIDGGSASTYQSEDKGWQSYLAQRRAIIEFFKSEGVGAVLQPSTFPYGVVRAAGYYDTREAKNVPGFVIGKEQYARIRRLKEAGKPVSIRLNLSTSFSDDTKGYNIIGEIPGSNPSLKKETILLGGHFDSWHGGTGVADNAANCIVMLEALRILKATGLKPLRTIRVGLWSGEEQDYFGSYNYVKNKYGDPKTGNKLAAHSDFNVYYNLDNGGGKIRGLYLQGNEKARPFFETVFKPFKSMSSSSLSVLSTGGTDHMVFDGIGLPGFQFIQDPLDYNTRVHHSNLDVLESVIEEDLKVNAVIVATLAYHTAMRKNKIPRKRFN